MSFLGWTFLFGALAVAGPIAAHLLSKPRFRRAPFTMLRFLRSGQRESHSRRRLRDVLVLLLRCAAIVLIAVLFARPVLHVTPPAPPQRSIHYLALDDSMSMAYRDGDMTLFERMTASALAHVRDAPDGSVFNICALASQWSAFDLDTDQAVAQIKKLKPVPKSAAVEGFFSALRQAGQTAAPDDTLTAAVFSDFSPNVLAQFASVSQPAVVDAVRHETIVPSKPIDNVAITDVRIAEMGARQVDLDVTVADYGGAESALGGRTLTVRALDRDPGAVQETALAQQRGTFRVRMNLGPRPIGPAPTCVPIELALSPDDGLFEDDSYRVAAYLPAAGSTRLLLVGEADETFLFATAAEALSAQGHLNDLHLRQVTPDRLTLGDLTWATVAVFSSPPSGAVCSPGQIDRCLRAGTKLICFATHTRDGQAARPWWQAGLLPALPEHWVAETAYLEAQPAVRDWFDLDDRAAQSLVGYRLDKTAVKGLWQCRMDPDARCLWRFANGAGFIYGKSLDRGLSVFVNTSIDDSLGLLAKSRAWVAFCRYLLGQADRMRLLRFSTTERPAVHLPEAGLPVQLAVENCDGRRAAAPVEGMTLHFPAPAGIGWMKTLDGPQVYAPINLPDGETDLGPPTTGAVAAAIRRTFVIGGVGASGRGRPELALSLTKGRARGPASTTAASPIWPAFAWAAIVLLLAESALANRLKR